MLRHAYFPLAHRLLHDLLKWNICLIAFRSRTHIVKKLAVTDCFTPGRTSTHLSTQIQDCSSFVDYNNHNVWSLFAPLCK